VLDGSKTITLASSGLFAGQQMMVKVTSTDSNTSGVLIATGNSGEYGGTVTLKTKPGASAMGGYAQFVWSGSAWWVKAYQQ